MKITDALLRKSVGKEQEKASYNDGNGLYIEISSKGTITFKVRYSFNAKQQRMKLGNYPTMSLLERD